MPTFLILAIIIHRRYTWVSSSMGYEIPIRPIDQQARISSTTMTARHRLLKLRESQQAEPSRFSAGLSVHM